MGYLRHPASLTYQELGTLPLFCMFSTFVTLQHKGFGLVAFQSESSVHTAAAAIRSQVPDWGPAATMGPARQVPQDWPAHLTCEQPQTSIHHSGSYGLLVLPTQNPLICFRQPMSASMLAQLEAPKIEIWHPQAIAQDDCYAPHSCCRHI